MKVESEGDDHDLNVTGLSLPVPSSLTLLIIMSAEFDDVLTNQPIVIDNVRFTPHALLSNPSPDDPFRLIGIWNDKSRFCWSRSSKMLLPVFVRFHG